MKERRILMRKSVLGTTKTKRCKWCGKEFIPFNKYQKFCSEDCCYIAGLQKHKIDYKIKNVAKLYNFDIKNKDKILNAKLLIFKDGNIHRCPCDADNPNRFCGSAQCIADVVYKGHCHCSLFWLKNKSDDIK